jgi:ABC-type sugar transport system permease subunit
MNTVVWHLQRFFQIIKVPYDFIPLASFIVLMAAIWAVYTGIVRFRLRRGTFDRKDAAFWMFISPWLIGFVVFTLGPMLFSLYTSFTRWNLLTPPTAIGFKNYSDAFQDPLMLQALKVTFLYALLSVPTFTIAAFLVAVIMNSRVRGMNVFRTMWYIPSLVVGVPQIVLFLSFFNPETGIANRFLKLFGITGPNWFFSPVWAMPTVAIMGLWTVGGAMLIYLAGLQDVPASLYEAVSLDGGGIIRKWWTVTVPQMSPIIFFNFLTGLIGAMQIFTQGFVAAGAGGGPNNSLLFMVVYLYENAFQDFKMGYASALSWILFFIILAMTLLTFKFSSGLVYYETDQSKAPGRRKRRGAQNVTV